MYIRVSLLSLFMGLSLNSPVAALELSSVVSDSIVAHPQVKEKIHVYRQVLSDQTIAQSGWRPRADVEASSGLFNTESPATGNTSVDYGSSRVELSLTQNLFNGYDTTHQIEQTKSRARAALFDLYDTADNIALDTIQAYLEVLKQRRLYELATENVSSHEGILSKIRERNNSGVGRRSQLQQTEGRVARAHASLIAQQNNLQDASTRLHQTLGRYVDPGDLKDPILPRLPPEDLNTLIDQALQNHPAMKVAQNNIKASLADYSRSRSSRYPNIDIRLASEWGDDLGGVSGNTDELSLVVNLSYNFYQGGADSAEEQKKISATYEQKEFAARVRRQVINTLRLAQVADESLTRQLVYLKTHTTKAKETVGSYREEFFIGQRDLIDLLDAENELNTAQNQHVAAYYDAMASRYRVYEAVGSLFEAMNLEVKLAGDNLEVAGVISNAGDRLPLPRDDDYDQEIDMTDHCDNSLAGTLTNIYGCAKSGQVEMGYIKVNQAPVVGNDDFELDGNGILIISQAQLLANDTDADNDSLSIVDVGKPGHGKLAFNGQKNLIYRPAEGYSGTDSFTYTVSDGNGATATATATVTLVVNKVLSIDLSKMQNVNFRYNKSELTDFSKTKVKGIIEQIRQSKNIKIEIYTYTDSLGSNTYNLTLSQRRASALKKLLIADGLDADKITATGLGEENPIADNTSKAGQAINRRGEFVFEAEGLQ